MMQTHLFLCETKMGFSKYSMFWKVGSGFETPTSLRAPLYEKIVKKEHLGRGYKTCLQAVVFEEQFLLFYEATALLMWQGFVGLFYMDSTEPGSLFLRYLYQTLRAVSE